jgi:hypothetical protein
MVGRGRSGPRRAGPPGPVVRIVVRLALSHHRPAPVPFATVRRPIWRFMWLLAGLAAANLHPPDGLLEKATLALQRLLPG